MLSSRCLFPEYSWPKYLNKIIFFLGMKIGFFDTMEPQKLKKNFSSSIFYRCQ
jgi:hypothetical protein